MSTAMSADDLRERMIEIMGDPSKTEEIHRVSSGSNQRAYLTMSGEVAYQSNMQMVGGSGNDATSSAPLPHDGFAWIDNSPPSSGMSSSGVST